MSKSENLETKDIRTKDRNVRFGHIHSDQVKSSVILQGQGGQEYITIDQTGGRKAWITTRARGRYQVKCGDNIPEGDVAIYISSGGENGLSLGNIEIHTKGVFKVNAKEIQLIATGTDNSTGRITLQSNEEIKLDSKQININAKEAISIFSDGELNTTAKNIMKMTAGSYQKLSSASALKSPGLAANLNQKTLTSAKPTKEATPAETPAEEEEDLLSEENTQLTGNETAGSFESGGAASGGALAE